MKNYLLFGLLCLALVFTGCTQEIIEENNNVESDKEEILAENICTEEQKQNLRCTREYNPVCGDDGKTYATACVGCSSGQIDSWEQGECAQEPFESTDEIFVIGPEKKDCVGVAPMKCLIVNGNFFYDRIEGFAYEEGYDYEIKVKKTTKAEPIPADASIYKYELIETISKEKVSVENVCTSEQKDAMICTMEYAPVCGDDGKTYGNDCGACASGEVDSWTQGECETQ